MPATSHDKDLLCEFAHIYVCAWELCEVKGIGFHSR